MANTSPQAPNENLPPESWEHFDLFVAVRKALFSLPSRFESSLSISGILATDLFAFNTSLGATIEEQVVTSLNKLRSVWDPNQIYALYDFERRPQTFPDVVLKASSVDIQPQIILGIELKGWYVLAKEREPSFRYKVTPAVCADADLLVVVPWALSEVISGTPRVFAPYVTSAKYAAEYRNWYWEHQRVSQSNQSVTLSTANQNYPIKSDTISDRPASDSGGNFGRFARTGAMDNYMLELFNERLTGIPLAAWQRFLSIFTEGGSSKDIDRSLERLVNSIVSTSRRDLEVKSALLAKLHEIASLVEDI